MTIESPQLLQPTPEQSTEGIVEQVKAENFAEMIEQKEALASNPDLRQLVTDVIAIRFPDHTEDSPSEPYELGNFEGMQQAMARSFDTRTKKNGEYGERHDAEELLFDEETDKRIYALAENFGLTGNTYQRIRM